LHRFQDIADVKFSLATGGHFTLTLSLGVIPWEYRYKWYTAKTILWAIHFTRRMCRCIFNHFYVIGPKASEFWEITQTKQPLRRLRSFTVTDFGTNRRPTGWLKKSKLLYCDNSLLFLSHPVYATFY